jgi:hypothetical protein
MGYALRPGVTFCRTSDRLVFLDRKNDRYFGMSEDAERAFNHLVSGDGHVETLVATGLLVSSASPTCGVQAFQHRLPPTSLIECALPSVSGAQVISVVARQMRCRAELSLFGLHRALCRFERLRETMERRQKSHDQMAVIIAAHQAAMRLTATHTRCLPNSLAVARHLAASGHAVRLVFGVKLRPFEAHCWAEVDGRIVNDRTDIVHSFTPILAV